MSRLALLKLHSFNSQEIANTMWSYATMNHPAPEFFLAVSNLSLSKLNMFNPQELANALWSFATLRHPAPEFFDAVSNLTISNLHAFNSQELTKIIWAYATVHHYYVNPHFTNGMLWKAIQKVESLESEQIVNILWSVAVLNSIDAQSVMPMFSEISKRYHSSLSSENNHFQLSSKALSQLHQASLWYSDEHNYMESLLPSKLREECYTDFISENTTISEFQREVVKSLKSLPGITIIEEESRCERTGYSIDVLIKVHEQVVAVEVDGPYHFVGYSPNGATMLKQRQFFALGNTPLLSIPYWEWNSNTSHSTNNNYNNNATIDNNWSNNNGYYNNNNNGPYLQQRLACFL